MFAANWADIRWQISYSNVIQRDNAEFVRRLDRTLVDMAKEKAKEVRHYRYCYAGHHFISK